MNEKFLKELINPLEFIEKYLNKNIDVSHITFNPKLRASDSGFYRRQRSAHDGTTYFTMETLANLLSPLIRKTSYCKNDKIDFEKLKDIQYEVGFVKLVTVFGTFDQIVGQRESARISVKCKYIY